MNTPKTTDLYEWDIDRLVFYIGELESQVARLSKPEPEDTVTVTLDMEQAERIVAGLSDAFDYLEGGTERSEEVADGLTEIYDAIVPLVPTDD